MIDVRDERNPNVFRDTLTAKASLESLLFENLSYRRSEIMTTTKEPLVEVRDGKEYELFPVHHKGKCIGLAPVRSYTDIDAAEAEAETPEARKAFREWLFTCGMRQAAQDVMNAVRAKYNKDKVTASTVIKACNNGDVSPEQYQESWDAVGAGTYKDLTTAICTMWLSLGEDAFKKADPTHIHWDCAR